MPAWVRIPCMIVGAVGAVGVGLFVLALLGGVAWKILRVVWGW